MAEEEKDKKPETVSKEAAEKPATEAAAKKEEPAKEPEPPKEGAKVEEKKPEEKAGAVEGEKKEEVKPEEPKVEAKPAADKPAEKTEEEKDDAKESENGGEKKGEEVKEKKKGFRLPFFGKKKKEEVKEGADEKSEGGEESEEGEDGKELESENAAKETEDEALSTIEKVEEELAKKISDDVQLASDVFVIKISKSRLMLVLGILVLAMWMIPAVRGVQLLLAKSGYEFNFGQKQEVTPEEEDVVKIRIRHSPDQDAISDELSTLLKDGGYDFIEIEEDGEASFEGMAVVTKNTDVETRIKIESLLSSKYKVASPSAELTDDSDFDAVIIIGKQGESK